ncbi:MAG TPA: DNA polymerase [Pedococcus sp.]
MAVLPLAFVTAPTGRSALVGPGQRLVGPTEELVGAAASLEAGGAVRWVWWAASADASPLVAHSIALSRCWDVAEAHRLLVGGWEAAPQSAWATAHGLDRSQLPAPSRGDLFDFSPTGHEPGPGSVVRRDGYLAPEAGTARWRPDDETLLAWGQAALDCAGRQEELLAQAGPRAVATAQSESAASLLCVELGRDGLPLDRARTEQLITEAAGPRPDSEAHARAIRADRDQLVLGLVPGHERTDLRNPVQVKELLASAGVDVPNTRKWVLEPFRDTSGVVAALLDWRKAERIATTYGWGWLEAHVGPDDRLRGGWTACDGAAGRMTAQNGLHNLPASLRPAVAAHPGHVLVRADLGQIEPRVLAAVSGDAALAAATRADDLYAPVAAALGVERPVAKVAVLAAMYGQRSGAAGEALRGLERAYPVAMGFLDRAYAAGLRREPMRTFGGRLIPLDTVLADVAVDGSRRGGALDASEDSEAVRSAAGDPARDTGRDSGRDAARGRFARNAVIQGSAAELFKAWAATVRATTRDLGAQIVLCLHDELLVHVPQQHAELTQQRVEQALSDSARRWTGSTAVRFVAEASVISRWSEAKQ